MRAPSPPRRLVGLLRAHPTLADTALAVLLAALVVPSFYGEPTLPPGSDPRRAPDVLGLVLLLLSVLPLGLRRRHPPAILAAVLCASVGSTVLHYPGDGAGGLGVVVALYTVAAHCRRRTSRTALVVVLLGVGVVLATAGVPVTADAVVGNGVIFVTGWVLGDNLRTRRAYTRSLEERNRRLEQDQDEAAREAVATERRRIARELHDVVAHSVSVMVVQATAARRVLPRDPDRAAEALTIVEATGREALTEMRRLLGVLRDDDSPTAAVLPPLAPQPGIGDVEALVQQFREAGLDVRLATVGEPRPVAPGVDLAAYRVVQEALTNALKHAGPAHAEVALHWGRRELGVVVRDDGWGAAASLQRTGPAGHGLRGMRERVGLYGGLLSVGPRRGGGYQVAVTLPLDGAEQRSPAPVSGRGERVTG